MDLVLSKKNVKGAVYDTYKSEPDAIRMIKEAISKGRSRIYMEQTNREMRYMACWHEPWPETQPQVV